MQASGVCGLGSTPSTPNFMQKGQIQILFILGVILIIVAAVFGIKSLGGRGGLSEPIVENPDDQSSPVRSNLFPNGILSSGTREVQISVTLNEPGYCRYSKESEEYDRMRSRFEYSDDKTFHKATIKGLREGKTYTYFVRCRDLAGNRNQQDAVIKFTVGRGTAGGGYYPGGSYVPPESPPMRFNLYPTGTLPAGTGEVEISVSTNEPGYCRYSKQSEEYDRMSYRMDYNDDKTLHTETVRGLQDNRLYKYYVRCRDMDGNRNQEDALIEFSVGGVAPEQEDEEKYDPPYRYDPIPAEDQELPYYVKTTTIGLKTDEEANCRYSVDSGFSYEGMYKYFDQTWSTEHTVSVGGFSEGKEYKYYVRCIDREGYKNTNDFVITVKIGVPEDTIPPKRWNLEPKGTLPAGTEKTYIGVTTNESADCKYSEVQGVEYKDMRNYLRSQNDEETYHTARITKLEDGKSYSFFVRCRDEERNVNDFDVIIRFSVGTE